MSMYANFPERESLLSSYLQNAFKWPLKVNNHIHTPYSFSAFGSVDEAVERAAAEGVKVLGINDFYVCDGYQDFLHACRRLRVFPLLNIELIGVNRSDQEEGIRVNDPKNPGRTYISGKGLAFPSVLPGIQQEKLDRVVEESNRQVAAMIDLANRWLEFHGTGLRLSEEEIRDTHARELLRERHVAKALRIQIEEASKDEASFYKLLTRVYGGKPTEKSRDDLSGLEDELRARLLKSGAPAFVPEDEKAFMPLEEICRIIKDAGGIPTYPMLLDGAGGHMTEFESDRERLLERLKERGFSSVELIPLRNRFEVLKSYAEFFYENGFVVSFGTEHNTSAMGPLTVSCLEAVALDESLEWISFKGAAYLAAHQYLYAREGADYPAGSREEMEELGMAVIQYDLEKNESHG